MPSKVSLSAEQVFARKKEMEFIYNLKRISVISSYDPKQTIFKKKMGGKLFSKQATLSSSGTPIIAPQQSSQFNISRSDFKHQSSFRISSQ